MPRWVLQEQVWAELLDEAGFVDISVEEWPGGERPRAAATLLESV